MQVLFHSDYDRIRLRNRKTARSSGNMVLTCDNHYWGVPHQNSVYWAILLGPNIEHGVGVERDIQLQATREALTPVLHVYMRKPGVQV